MRTIWKRHLEIVDVQEIAVPLLARPLAVAEQHELLTIWFDVPDHENPVGVARIRIFGTGGPIPAFASGDYVGTVVMMGGTAVWHVFWMGPFPPNTSDR